jgi:hypothetical protein
VKRALAFVLAFVASLALIRCSAYLAAAGDLNSYLAAAGCGIVLFAVVITMVAVAEEMEK